MTDFSMPNMSELRIRTMEVRNRREELNREMGRIAAEAVRFLAAMAAIVSHGGVEVRFAQGPVAFRIHMGEKGRYIAEYDLQEHDEETRRYMDDFGLDVRMTGYLYILNHAEEIARVCTEAMQARCETLDGALTRIRSLGGAEGNLSGDRAGSS